ncbi:MAG: NTP transferase domain-containing protein [Candidatus Cloacimonetes bacterium]|nr:NTP transferase domain-containing protein [Candidatus Cloacimonadota bacterium]
MKAVVMAGGLGMRLRPLTSVIPKPMLPVGDRSILEIILLNLKSAGVDTVYIAVNYMSEYFKAHFEKHPIDGLDIIFSNELEPLGTAGPLGLLRDNFEEPFLVVNGDILTNLDFSKFYQFFLDEKADILVGTKKLFLPTNYGVISSMGTDILSIEEKPQIETEIVAGIYCLSPNVLNYIPRVGFYQMNELLQKVLEIGKLKKYLISDYWLDIGHMENYEQAQKDINEYLPISINTAQYKSKLVS